MEGVATTVLILFVAYLLGSIPTSSLVVRWLTGRDIRSIGTGIPGAMNVLDNVGVRPAVLVALGDMGKGMAAVSVAYFAGFGDGIAILAGAVAVAGHDWSIFLRFRGGNGTATTVGAIVALLPGPGLLAILLALALAPVVPARRLAGLAGLLAVVPLAFLFGAADPRIVGAGLLVALLFIRLGRVDGFTLVGPRR